MFFSVITSYLTNYSGKIAVITFTSSRTVIGAKTLKTPQLSSQLFRKAHATSGILGRNNLKKGPRNPGRTDPLQSNQGP